MFLSFHTSFEIHMDAFLYNVDNVFMRGQTSRGNPHTRHQQYTPWRGLQPLDDRCHDERYRAVFRITVIEKRKDLF